MDVPLSHDPRWLKLCDRAWVCPCCGETHAGLFDLACDRLDFWKDGAELGANAAVLTSDHALTEDFCILNGEHSSCAA
jgi:hypothetical protein